VAGADDLDLRDVLGGSVTSAVDTLVLDLLEWLGPSPRPYAEVLETWRTSCPRLAVWEEANEHGYIDRLHVAGAGQFVAVSARGRAHLHDARRCVSAPRGR
jgi:hypothetical protein